MLCIVHVRSRLLRGEEQGKGVKVEGRRARKGSEEGSGGVREEEGRKGANNREEGEWVSERATMTTARAGERTRKVGEGEEKEEWIEGERSRETERDREVERVAEI